MLKVVSRFVWTLWGGMEKDFSVKFALETSSTLAILGHTDLFIQAMTQMSNVNKRLSKLGPFSVTESRLPLPAARNERLWSNPKRGQLRLVFAEQFHFMTFFWNLVSTWKIIILVHETPQTIILNCLQEFRTLKTIMVEESAIKIISKTLTAFGYDFYTERFLEVIWLSTHIQKTIHAHAVIQLVPVLDYSRASSAPFCQTRVMEALGKRLSWFASIVKSSLPDLLIGSTSLPLTHCFVAQ